MRKEIICLVERGWKEIREFSLVLAKEKIICRCIIKGKLEREVLDIVTKYDYIFIIPIERNIFKIFIFFEILIKGICQKIIYIVIDNRKTYEWIRKLSRFLNLPLFFILEKENKYSFLLDGKELSKQYLLTLAKGQNENCPIL